MEHDMSCDDTIEPIARHKTRPVNRKKRLGSKRIRLNQKMIDESAEQMRLFKSFVNEQMVESVDYGKIPGLEGMTLLKPGAEKICRLYGCTPRYFIEDKTQHIDTKFFSYIIRCELYDIDGDCVAEGLGYCTSYESKYLLRKSERCCPNCGRNTIRKSRPEYGNKWYCAAKHGGCGASFDADDKSITEQRLDSVINEAIFDLINTVLKMAMKRALVSAAQSVGACSGIFTQDLEDIAENTAAAVEMGIIPPNTAGQLAPQAQKNGGSSQGQTPHKQNDTPTFICSNCGVKAVQRSKYPPRNQPNEPPGWHCYERLGGCKSSFPYSQYEKMVNGNDQERRTTEHQPTTNNQPAPDSEQVKKPAKKESVPIAAQYSTRMNRSLSIQALDSIRPEYIKDFRNKLLKQDEYAALELEYSSLRKKLQSMQGAFGAEADDKQPPSNTPLQAQQSNPSPQTTSDREDDEIPF